MARRLEAAQIADGDEAGRWTGREAAPEVADPSPDDVAVVECEDTRVIDEDDAAGRTGGSAALAGDEPDPDGGGRAHRLRREHVAGRHERLDRHAEPRAEDVLGGAQMLAMDVFGQPLVELAVIGAVAREQPRPEQPVLD